MSIPSPPNWNALDQHPELLEAISGCVAGSTSCGRDGQSCETILRCAVLKHLMGYSYRELEFALLDSATMQLFARLDPFRVPRKSALQSAISAIDVEAWRSINGVLLQDAKGQRIEPGRQVRIDSTVTETDILESSDSRLCTTGAGADAAAASGAGAAWRRCRFATTAVLPSGASRKSALRAAPGGQLPAVAELGGEDDRLRGGGSG